MSTKQFMGNVSWSMLSHLFSRGSMMLSAMLLARSLSASDFAMYSYFQLTSTMIATYSAMGIGITASKLFAELQCSDTLERHTHVVRSIGTLWMSSIFLSSFVALIILFLPSSLLNSGLKISALIFCIGVFVMALAIVPNGAILGLEKYKQVAIISFFTGLINLIGVYFSIREQNSTYSMIFLISSVFFQLVGETLIIRTSLGWDTFRRFFYFDKSKISSVAVFIGPMMFVSIFSASGMWVVGKIILNHDNTHYNFSLYAIGLQWYSLALFVPLMISRVALPIFIKSKNKDETNNKMVSRSLYLSFLISFVFFGVGFLFKDQIIGFYGNSYSDFNMYIPFFLFVACINSPANILGNILIGNDEQLTWMCIVITSFICLVGFAWFFRDYGVWMGVISFSMYSIVLVFLALLACKNKGYA